jgi:2-C-methyl-D-erythritol 2,4-cyclodiphosphate synthase
VRVGIGYDVHSLVAGRKLILGGVHIPFNKGLLGHSDADVLVHAIIDALLGASGLKDIGTYYSSEDQRYKDVSSLSLLKDIGKLIEGNGIIVGNIDATVVVQQPKLGGFIDDMRKKIAGSLHIAPGKVTVKATTTEGLGFAGRGEGIAAYAVALVQSVEQENIGGGNG